MKMKKYSLLQHIVFTVFTLVAFTQCIKNKYSFEDGYDRGGEVDSNITVDTTLKFIDVSKFAAASVFPGLVCNATEKPRLMNHTQSFNFNYSFVGEGLRISVAPQPLFSTGLYVAPGELLIVDVPIGLNSLSIQVGAWTDNLSNIPDAPRDALIYSRSQLAPGRNYFRNLYGGPIYLTALRPITTPVNLTFSNVLKMADFDLESGMTDADWKAQLNASCVPWLELKSKHIIFTISKEYCLLKPISDVERLMRRWDEIIKRNYYDWEGLSENASDPRDQSPLLPWRVVLDIKPSVGYLHSGYPVVGTNDFEIFDEITNYEQRVSRGISWGILHEIGHNNQQGRYWSWGSLGEVTCNIFACRETKRQGYFNQAHPALPTDIPKALSFANAAGTKDFDGTDANINTPFARLTPFLQIMFKYPNGDSLITKMYQAARRALRPSNNDQDKRDFFYETICDATQLDWILFFDKWGIKISNISANKIGNKGYAYYTKELWKYNPLTDTGGDTEINLYSRSNWSITNFSSQEATGEGPPSGLIAAILDNNPSTFWHSVWSSASATPPHSFTIDMKVPFNINGFFFTQRQSLTRNIRNIKIEVSMDGTIWEMIPNSTNPSSPTTFTLQSITAQQDFTIPTKRFRYFRATIPTAADVFDGTNNAALAEIGVIY